MAFDSISRYPLSWPAGWKRTPSNERKRSLFKIKQIGRAVREVSDEVQRLGGQNLIISTNLVLRQDGLPRADQKLPADRGVAVYFLLDNHPRVLACDAWSSIEENLWAIAKHIETIRAQDRYKVGTLEQAFRGYDALPEPQSAAPWWEVLEVPNSATREQVELAYKRLLFHTHPDHGGSSEEFIRVQEAYKRALEAKGATQ